MTEPRKPRLIMPVAGVAVLLTAYVGAYYALVEIPSFAIDIDGDRVRIQRMCRASPKRCLPSLFP
jgi:hypothetical protein